MTAGKGTTGKGKKRAIHALWLNHTSLVSGGEESMRAVLAQWQRGRAGEFSGLDAVAALPGEGPFAGLLRDDNIGVVFAPLRRLARPNGLFESASLLAHVWQTAPLVARLIHQSNSDIVHANSTTAHLVSGVAASRVDVPAIWHARDLIQLGRGAQFLSSRAAAVIAISGCVAESLQRQGVAPEKIHLIRNGIEPDKWKFDKDAPRRLRKKLKWDAEFIFGSVGQMVPWKNHEAFLHAAALLKEDEGCAHARFVIAGGDLWNEQEEYLQKLRALAKELGLGARVKFVEFQKDNHDLIGSLDCLVHPALEEPLGRVLIEALALGVPAVAFARNGPLEIIQHGHDGLLARSSTPESLVRQMKRVILDDKLRAHLSHNGPRTVREKFHIADVARQTAKLYRETVG